MLRRLALIPLLLAGCAAVSAPPPGANLAVNPPLDLRLSADRAERPALGGIPVDQRMHQLLLQGLEATGHFRAVQLRPAGDPARPPAVRTGLILDSEIQSLDLSRRDDSAVSFGIGLGTGPVGVGLSAPLGGRGGDRRCATAVLQGELTDAATGVRYGAARAEEILCRGDGAGDEALLERALEAATRSLARQLTQR